MIELPQDAPMRAYQKYIHQLEEMHGWLDIDLIHNCFLMGEEVGELFKAVRKHQRYYAPKNPSHATSEEQLEEQLKENVAEEMVDVLNYVIALANRLDIDLERAFRKKNARNQTRTWDNSGQK